MLHQPAAAPAAAAPAPTFATDDSGLFWPQFLQWAMTSPEYGRLATQYQGEVARLWQHAIQAQGANASSPAVDRRFAAEQWSGHPSYGFMRDSYLATARFMESAVEAADLDEKAKGQLRFFTRQYVNAIAPSNYLVTNPEAMQLALQSQGGTLRRGVANLIEDVAQGRISTVDQAAFEVGRNLAVTPGAVVYENELMQLIQYQAATDKVFERPLLMVPPCINKFYVLDLQPENSLIRYAVEQGHTVFVISWRNPGPELGDADWNDYIEKGPLAAIEVVRAISGQKRINTLGFCVGGTIVSTALAVLAARGDHAATSVTLFATLLDFSDAGEIGHFIDEVNVTQREAMLANGGLLSGRELAAVFSALRDNDLIWSYVVSNYLKGERPAAFDILYWNADSTNLPGPMFTWYVRNMYLENKLRVPDALVVCDEHVNLRSVDASSYIVATREDHIVPWRSAYESTQLIGRGVRFVLGASGHIAGIINPAAKNRRSYWTVDNDAALPAAPDRWLKSATEHQGSWWPDWIKWLNGHGGKRQAAPRQVGDTRYRPIEPAPGRYVKERIA